MTTAQNLKQFRTMLETGERSKDAAVELIEQSASAYRSTQQPVYLGFLAVGNFFMANHVFNPLKKMAYFREGKKNLEKAVRLDPSNLQLRLMRLIAQENIPAILNYSHHRNEDRSFLKENYNSTPDTELRNYIKNYLKL